MSRAQQQESQDALRAAGTNRATDGDGVVPNVGPGVVPPKVVGWCPTRVVERCGYANSSPSSRVLRPQASHETCVGPCLVATEIWARSANALPSSKACSGEAGPFWKKTHWHHGKGGSLWSISSIPVSASVPRGRPPCSCSRGGNVLIGGRLHLKVRSPIWVRDYSAACPILVTPCRAAVGGRPLFWCPPA